MSTDVIIHVTRILTKSGKYTWILLAAFSLGWLALIPPFQLPDEPAHFFKATTLPLPDYLDGQYGHLTTTSSMELIHQAQLHEVLQKSDVYYRPKKFFTQPIYPGGDPYFYPSAIPNTFLPYLGFGVSYWLSIAFGGSLQLAFYAMRLGGFMYVAALLFLAYRSSPLLVAGIAPLLAIPMLVNQVIGISADGYTLAMTITLLAVARGYASDDTHSRRILPVVVFLFMSVKVVYLPLLLLLVPILLARRADISNRYIAALLIAFVAGALMQYYYISHRTPDMAHPIESIARPGEQIQYLLSNPTAYLHVLLNTITRYRHSFATGLFGNIGWLDTPMSDGLLGVFKSYTLIFLALSYCICFIKGGVRVRAIVMAGCVIMISALAIYTSMYVIWTPVGAPIIDGVQGRYFLPLLLVLAAAPILYGRNADSPHQGLQATYLLATIPVLVMSAYYAVSQVYPRFYGG
jgi:uncharacterized membrane protein